MARILSDAELEELTGYKAPGKQLEALRRIGLIPLIRADGRPRVTDDAVTQAMLGRAGEVDPTPAGEPNWDAIRPSRKRREP